MHISTKCSIAVHCLLFIHEYEQTEKVTSQLLALSAGCNPVVIRNILSALKKAGILSNRQGIGGVVLCCPLAEITLLRIWQAVEPKFPSNLIGIHATPSHFCPVGRKIHSVLTDSYAKVYQELCASMEKITMLEIVERYHTDGYTPK